MCGIFGYVLDAKRAPAVEQRTALVTALAVGNTRRGRHSWGAYCHAGAGDRNGEVLKGLGPMAAVQGLDTLALGTTLLAHTRFATTGAVTTENSHPFTIGNVLGAHNGMVYNHAELSVKYRRRIEVDSEHLFHHVAEAREFTDVIGYGTVEYVRLDGDLREVHLCKMMHGQLAVYGLGNRKKPYGVVWSSDEADLRSALRSAGLKGFPYALRTGRVYVASPDGVLYKTDTEHNLGRATVSKAAQEAAERLTRGEGKRSKPVRVVDGTTNMVKPASEIDGLTRMPDGTYVTKVGQVVEVDLTEGEATNLFAEQNDEEFMQRTMDEFNAALVAGKVN